MRADGVGQYRWASIDVAGRMTFLSLEPAIRTRLTTSYIVIMFLGGALGSILGTAIYDLGGWAATCAMLMAISLSVLSLSLWAQRKWDARVGAAPL